MRRAQWKLTAVEVNGQLRPRGHVAHALVEVPADDEGAAADGVLAPHRPARGAELEGEPLALGPVRPLVAAAERAGSPRRARSPPRERLPLVQVPHDGGQLPAVPVLDERNERLEDALVEGFHRAGLLGVPIDRPVEHPCLHTSVTSRVVNKVRPDDGQMASLRAPGPAPSSPSGVASDAT